jgi:hypothetical protein
VPRPGGLTLPPGADDDPLGYYYPEKGKACRFRAHGRIRVDRKQVVPLEPEGELALALRKARKDHENHPYTCFALVRSGRYVYILQAKRINGRKLLFAKRVRDGDRPVEMTHWARLTGWDAAGLMKLAGIDPAELDRRERVPAPLPKGGDKR